MHANPYSNALREFMGVADAMNRTLERAPRPYDYARNGGSVSAPAASQAARLPIDAWANEDAYFLTAYLPGVDAESVEITFEADELLLRGSFQPAAEEVNFVKRELFHGPFERRVTFNVPVNADAIEATFENGVLTLRVPKAESVKPKQIKVVAK